MKVAKTFSLFPFLRTQQSWKRPPSLATVQRILFLIIIVHHWFALCSCGEPAMTEEITSSLWIVLFEPLVFRPCQKSPKLAFGFFAQFPGWQCWQCWQCWQTNERKYDDDNIRLPPLSFQWTVSLPLTIHHFCTFSFWKLFSCWGDFYLTLS